jgi:hypothetical protein
MSDHHNPDSSGWDIAARVIFAIGLTIAVAVGAYLAIAWLIQR